MHKRVWKAFREFRYLLFPFSFLFLSLTGIQTPSLHRGAVRISNNFPDGPILVLGTKWQTAGNRYINKYRPLDSVAGSSGALCSTQNPEAPIEARG